uniref:Uncharacterized protein n=1 Tax=Rhipicephalus microplus TaxID=6941 RepID=A0A6G5AHL1_RHIMP
MKSIYLGIFKSNQIKAKNELRCVTKCNCSSYVELCGQCFLSSLIICHFHILLGTVIHIMPGSSVFGTLSLETTFGRPFYENYWHKGLKAQAESMSNSLTRSLQSEKLCDELCFDFNSL